MDALGRTFSDLVCLFNSCIPWRSEPAHVSRDFWTPDRSCRVCYECDSQFTLFNRRHHCRLCGRIFCARCSSNWVPTPSSDPKTQLEEWDKIRVCNYCFKQWQHGLAAAPVENESQVANPDLSSTSPSATGFIRTKSSGTCDSSSITFVSLPHSAGFSPRQPAIMETSSETQIVGAATSNDHVVDIEERNQSQNQLGFCQNRSDDEDEEFGVSHLDSRASNFSEVNGYFGRVQYDDIDNDYNSRKVHADGDAVDTESTDSSSLQSYFDSQALVEVEQMVQKGVEHDISDESEAASLYVEDMDTQPVDFENSGVLWLPPEPEDEEDEREALLLLFEDDDDGNGCGEWGYLCNSSSFGSGEYRIRDKSSEEHKRAMKSLVDGHFRDLVAQTLHVENLPTAEENEKESWLDIITALSWEAATLLKPDMSKGGQMDPGGYVKVKCLASGHRSESMVVKGVVCKKNVAHRQMTSKIEKARLLILGGALEYQRVSNALSSFYTLLQQEMDHLKMAVAKIDAHHPNILLVEKSVSRCAREYLLAKDVSFVSNIKRPILERIARCTGGQIVPSIDHLSSPKLGYCDMFHVEKFFEEHGSAGQAGKKQLKTLMYFEGCPEPLGCTILLRGANGDELKKVKHVVQYGVFAAYHLALETSFLADEGASLGTSFLEEQPTIEEFQPSSLDHKSILVSLSSRCVWKGTICERSHLILIKYYSNFDKPLGRFLQDHLFDQNYRCHSCEMPTEAHVQCYTHQQGTLMISVKKLPVLLPGERDQKIWMWHRCLRCPRANGFPPVTRRVVMSDASWGLSFGKFLDLSFSNHAAASCGHSLHRDCLRFYGFGEMVACFRYASVDVHSVYLPPPKLDFNCQSQEWIEREFNEVTGWAELLFSEVLNALHLLVERKSGLGLLSGGTKVTESWCHIADLEGILQKEKSEFEDLLQKILNKGAEKGQPTIDILELNRLRRQLVFQSYMWGRRLIYADSLDNKSQPDDTEVTFSESIQNPLAVTEKLVDVNVPVKTVELLNSSDSFAAYAKPDQSPEHGFDSHNIHHPEVLHGKTDAFFSSDAGNQNSLTFSIGIKATDESDDVRILSDGQASICLSDTLDAAWTGENHPGAGIPKNNNSSESVEADNLSTVALSEKFDVKDQGEDLNGSKVSNSPSFLSYKSSDNVEDTVSSSGMSSVSFYRSLNKNFLGSAQKLDRLSEYDPIYISSFRESELQGGARLRLPVGVNDIVIPVYDDEPTSIIAYALASPDYLTQLSDEPELLKGTADSLFSMHSLDSSNFQSFHSLDEMNLESYRSQGSGDETILPTSSRSSLPLDPLSHAKAVHARVSFADDGPLGMAKYTVTCYYAKHFEALRRTCCPSEVDYIRSLSHCRKWGAQGGKSNVFFAKTFDDRFIIKQVTKTELESFMKFAPAYFKYVFESIGTQSSTCLARILGIYKVTSKHLKGGKESKMDLLVMENLFFGRNLTRLYDLKGSSRSRYNPDSSGSNKVLLDQNLIEAMSTSPIFVGNKAKGLLERSVWNDTAFLASMDVMDYSLLVGVDEERHELVLGIIDFMRQYTWDKHLETWVMASGILGGSKNASPTIISPKQYKRRFRKAMATYFLVAPDRWSPPSIIPSKSRTNLCEEDTVQNEGISAQSEKNDTPSAE